MLTTTPSWIPLLLAGNLLAVLAALILFGTWVRRLFRKHVSDPLRNLQSSVDDLGNRDAALESEVKTAAKLAQSAHERIDQILLGDRNA